MTNNVVYTFFVEGFESQLNLNGGPFRAQMAQISFHGLIFDGIPLFPFVAVILSSNVSNRMIFHLHLLPPTHKTLK